MYGNHDNDLDKSYPRTVATFISGEQYPAGVVKVSVPKCSILGTILYLIYINDSLNDLPSVLSHLVVDIFTEETTLSTQKQVLWRYLTKQTTDRWANLIVININIKFNSSRYNNRNKL